MKMGSREFEYVYKIHNQLCPLTKYGTLYLLLRKGK